MIFPVLRRLIRTPADAQQHAEMLQLCYRVVRHTHDPAVFCENCQKIRKYFMQHDKFAVPLACAH